MNFSLNNVKKNIKWLAYLLVSILHFIFLALPAFLIKVSYGSNSQKESISAYEILGADNDLSSLGSDGGAGFVVVCLILLNIVTVLMMIALIYKLVIAFFGRAIKDAAKLELPTQLGPVKLTQVCDIAYLAFMGVNVLTFVVGVIFGIANSQSVFGAKLSVSPGLGLWLMLFFSVGVFVAYKVIMAKFPELLNFGPKEYKCVQCGTPARGAGFCTTCGGRVEAVAPAPVIAHVCDSCGARYKQPVAFCAKCGGRVNARQIGARGVMGQPQAQYQAPQSVSVCSRCGQIAANPDSAFCNQCGGPIVKR